MLSFRDVVKLAFTPAREIEEKEKERSDKNSAMIKDHLRRLEEAATKHVTESTDEAAEFEHGIRS